MNKKNIGMRIRNIRISKNMAMEEFSEKINQVNPKLKPGKSNVSRWEKGFNIPSALHLAAIAEIGGMTVEELLSSTILENFSDKELLEELLRRQMMKSERKTDV